MNNAIEITRSTQLWPLKPTAIERQYGRLMRGPDHPPADPPPADPPPAPSLVNDPPADPNSPPADPNAPPADPNAPKPADPPKPPEPAVVEPLKVEDLTPPEGFELKPEVATQFLEILNGEMDPKDRAAALLDLHTKTISAAREADSQAWDTMQTEWKDAAKADPDIGGSKLQPTLTNVAKLLDEFGDKEVRSVFDLTGAGNNVHMIKFLNKIASTLTEGGYQPGGPAKVDNSIEATAARMFPTMKG